MNDHLIQLLRKEYETIETLSQDDWDRLLEYADIQGVTTLIYRNIKTSGVHARIPASVIHAMERRYLARVSRNARLYYHLMELIRALDGRGVKAALLKGTHLAEIVYSDIGLRPMGDADILVRQDDLERTVSTAFDLGYGFGDHQTGGTATEYLTFDIPPDRLHIPRLYHPETGMIVEVHASITSEISPFPIEPEELWNRVQTVPIEGIEVFTLHPQDLLLHLCLHFSYQHLFREMGLKALCDIGETLRYYKVEIVWDQVCVQAEKWRMRNILWLALHLSKILTGAEVPPDVLDSLKPDNPAIRTRMADLAAERILGMSRVSVPEYYSHLSERNSFKDKVRFIRERVFPSREFMSLRYLIPRNSPQIYAWYFLRIFGFISQSVRMIRRAASSKGGLTGSVDNDRRDRELRQWLAGQ